MKIFISWSGGLSQQVALVLRDWLPKAFQFVDPYVSSEDIDKGARWSTDISQELEDSEFGILCVTAENLDAPWVNFEAGALSKSLDKSRVVPFLFGVPRTAVQGPLVQFQSAGADHDDVKKLVRSMNKACDHGLDEPRLDEIFEVWWPELQTRLSKLTCTEPEIESPSRPTEEVLAEILELVRGQQKLLTNPASLFSPSDVEAMVRESLRGGDGAASWSLPVFDDLLTCWRRVQRATATEDEVPSGLAEALRRLSIPMTQVLSESRNSRGGSRELPGEL